MRLKFATITFVLASVVLLDSCKYHDDDAGEDSAVAGDTTCAAPPETPVDKMTMVELKRFVQSAGAKDLSALAQHQFYFEFTSNYKANAAAYADVQDAIAKKISSEYQRPVFDIRFIFGDKKSNTIARTVGIVGGTGPLSDSNLTESVINLLGSGKLPSGSMIHLFSLPPPRTVSEQVTGCLTYAARLATFLRHGYAQYFLASNTAYLNYNKVSAISGSKNINHLPKLIAAKIALLRVKQSKRDAVLILGTKQAWKGHLYDTIFRSRKIPNVQITDEESTEVQRWIDKIKQNKMSSSDRPKLKEYLASLGVKYKTKSLLLSCTELPLGLNSQITVLKRAGYTVYDTEKMMAEIIVEKSKALK